MFDLDEYALPVEYRRLGGTGLELSSIGLGCGNFGGIGSAPELFGRGENEAEAFAIMDRAAATGINFFDTAASYGDAELRIAFDRATFQPELAPDRRVGEVEEPQLLLETAEDADVRHPVVTTAFLGAVAEPELP